MGNRHSSRRSHVEPRGVQASQRSRRKSPTRIHFLYQDDLFPEGANSLYRGKMMPYTMWPPGMPTSEQLTGPLMLQFERQEILHPMAPDVTFDEHCGWPRRLLHVPTWTSLVWQPGNRYGHYVEPRYAALSYTWGRFQLASDQKPEVEALKLRGVDWPLPRIDPLHFTVEEFANVLMRTMAAPCWNTGVIEDGRFTSDEPVHFVWVDVACIDQQDVNTKFLEIGRQSLIFSRAAAVAIWLNGNENLQLSAQYSTLKTASIDFGEAFLRQYDAAMSQSVMKDLEEAVETILLCPWFSSLWTVQEAYIAKHKAIFYCKHGRPVFPVLSGTVVATKVLDFKTLGSIFYVLWRYLETQAVNPVISRLMIMIQKSGVTEVFESFPSYAFLATRYRQVTRQTDRVYGVMQLFGLALGASSPVAGPARTYTLDELEDQLGDMLMRKDQLTSHLFQFTTPPALGKAWRVRAADCCRLYGLENIGILEAEPYSHGSETVFSTRYLDNILWGYFTGHTCALEDLLIAAMTVGARLKITLDVQECGYELTEMRSSVLQGSIVARINEFGIPVLTQKFQTDAEENPDPSILTHGQGRAGRLKEYAAAAQFLQSRKAKAHVLRLSPGFGKEIFGIILESYQQDNMGHARWRRLGVCQWRTATGRTPPWINPAAAVAIIQPRVPQRQRFNRFPQSRAATAHDQSLFDFDVCDTTFIANGSAQALMVAHMEHQAQTAACLPSGSRFRLAKSSICGQRNGLHLYDCTHNDKHDSTVDEERTAKALLVAQFERHELAFESDVRGEDMSTSVLVQQAKELLKTSSQEWNFCEGYFG